MELSSILRANILISNCFISPFFANKKILKNHNVLQEEKLKMELEKVLIDRRGRILIPVNFKSKILELLFKLEHFFT